MTPETRAALDTLRLGATWIPRNRRIGIEYDEAVDVLARELERLALRSGEPESERMRAMGDEALAGPDTPADHNEEGHAKRPSGDPACDGGSVRAGSVVRPVDGGGGRPDRGRAARSVWQTLGDTPADSQEDKTDDWWLEVEK